jgi:hypothetical protein
MSDTTDDLDWGVDLWDDPANDNREEEWRDGKHTTKDGHTILIKDMTTSHLINAIKHFDHLNTKPLKKELKKRKP